MVVLAPLGQNIKSKPPWMHRNAPQSSNRGPRHNIQPSILKPVAPVVAPFRDFARRRNHGTNVLRARSTEFRSRNGRLRRPTPPQWYARGPCPSIEIPGQNPTSQPRVMQTADEPGNEGTPRSVSHSCVLSQSRIGFAPFRPRASVIQFRANELQGSR